MKKQENGSIHTTVYRKPTNNNIYINWKTYGPRQWKFGTLSGIIQRAYEICSTEDDRNAELNFISKVFTEINGYPHYIVNNMLKKFEDKHNQVEMTTPIGDSIQTEEKRLWF